MTNKRAYEKPAIVSLGSVESLTLASESQNAFDGYFLTPEGDITQEPTQGGTVALGSI